MNTTTQTRYARLLAQLVGSAWRSLVKWRVRFALFKLLPGVTSSARSDLLLLSAKGAMLAQSTLENAKSLKEAVALKQWAVAALHFQLLRKQLALEEKISASVRLLLEDSKKGGRHGRRR